jgi:Ca-activated chloride channel family protein
VSFAAPGYLLALLLVPVAVAGYREARRRRRRYAVRFPAFDTLMAVAPRGPDWRGHAPAALFLLALTGLVLALAKPERTVAVPVERASVVLVTDVSRSMQATDVSPSRLEAARGAADSFLGRVPDELRVGLVAFSDTAQTLQTPTTEHDDVRVALASLDTIAGTATGAGLKTALADLQIGTTPDRRPPSAIVLLSDGSATDGDAAFTAAREARRLRIPIYTVALGTPDGSVVLPDGRRLSVPPDPEALQRIAATSGGDAFQAQDSDELGAVYDRLGSQIGSRREQREITSTFAGIALLLLAGAVVGTLRWSGRLP